MNGVFTAIGTFIRRFPFCVGCIVASLLLAAGAWLLRGEVASLHIAHAERSKQGESMLATLVGGSTTRQELQDVRAATRRIEENLVIESNLAENLWYFYKLEEQTKVRLPELHQLSSPATDKSPLYRRVPYNLKVTGSYEQVAAFLAALETGPRLLKITNFDFGRASADSATLVLSLSIEVLGKR